jgi:hypothetical protein
MNKIVKLLLHSNNEIQLQSTQILIKLLFSEKKKVLIRNVYHIILRVFNNSDYSNYSINDQKLIIQILFTNVIESKELKQEISNMLIQSFTDIHNTNQNEKIKLSNFLPYLITSEKQLKCLEKFFNSIYYENEFIFLNCKQLLENLKIYLKKFNKTSQIQNFLKILNKNSIEIKRDWNEKKLNSKSKKQKLNYQNNYYTDIEKFKNLKL